MIISDKINDLKNDFISDLLKVESKSVSSEEIYNKYLGRKGLINKIYPLLSKVSYSINQMCFKMLRHCPQTLRHYLALEIGLY